MAGVPSGDGAGFHERDGGFALGFEGGEIWLVSDGVASDG